MQQLHVHAQSCVTLDEKWLNGWFDGLCANGGFVFPDPHDQVNA